MKISNIAFLSGSGDDCDCEAINLKLQELETRIEVIESSQCDCEDLQQQITDITTDITSIKNRLVTIENSIAISSVRTAMSAITQFSGLGVSVISIGPTYNYWGIGALTTSRQWASASTYVLVTPQQFPELQWYQGEPTIGTAWVSWGGAGGTTQSLPVFADSSHGIYFTIPNTINPGAGATLKFTLTLILTPAS